MWCRTPRPHCMGGLICCFAIWPLERGTWWQSSWTSDLFSNYINIYQMATCITNQSKQKQTIEDEQYQLMQYVNTSITWSSWSALTRLNRLMWSGTTKYIYLWLDNEVERNRNFCTQYFDFLSTLDAFVFQNDWVTMYEQTWKIPIFMNGNLELRVVPWLKRADNYRAKNLNPSMWFINGSTASLPWLSAGRCSS